MDRWKAEQGRGREKRKIRRKKSRRERVRKKMQMREKVGKSRNTVFCQWFVAPEGRKVGSLKRGVRSQLARWVMKNCTPLWREVKMYKTPWRRTTFGSCDVEKAHAIVARSTFPSENVQSTPWSDHFWQLRCRKSARRCGAKHVWKPKCTEHTMLGPLLEVELSKKRAPLWREAHLEVKTHAGPYIHTCMHTYMHAHMHTYTHTHTYIHIHTCVRFAYAYTYCAHIHIHVHVHVHVRIHIHIHKYKYIYIYIHTHIYTHIYIYTYIYIYFKQQKNNLSDSTSPMFPSRLVLAPIFPCLAFVHQPLRLKLTPIYSGIQPSHGVTQKCKLRKLLSSGLQQVEQVSELFAELWWNFFVSAFFLLSQVVQTQGARLYGKLSRLKLDNLKSCCILHCSDNAA